ncbi:MAG TPA: hypothetical protein CFH81_02820 [Sulfurovum sp. UBA12169]|nr:MAG TPA: hypothetical protein CFH81_02820 [Sulfurovum sp. UBA12169]
MDIIEKELDSRKDEIQKEVELLFKANMKITNWDVAEADNKKAAGLLLEIMQEKLDMMRGDILTGKYDNY